MTKARIIAVYLFVISGFLILLIRYAILQITNHQTLLERSINNYSSVVATKPVRGGILDKNGFVLADNSVSYALAILPKDALKIEDMFTQITKYINLTPVDKQKYFKQLLVAKNYDWVIIKDDLSSQEIANLSAHSFEFPKVNLFAHTKRYYPFNDLYSPVIGYVGRISEKDKQGFKHQGDGNNYLSTDEVGKNGLEQQYESYLRGFLGKKVIQTNAYGTELGLMRNQPAIDGYTLKLTLDSTLQKKAYDLLGNNKGAIVAIDPQTGGILAFVSKPAYDPNLFVNGISPEDWDDLRDDSRKPLINRVIQGTYPPGSTFKPFLAAAALHAGIRTPTWRMNDPGYITLPGSKHKFRNAGNEAPGIINISDAIRLSSDVFFYKLGLDMGIDKINQLVSEFGLGYKTGIDLPHEYSGLLPSRAWKAKRFANGSSYQKNWQLSDSVNTSVGQGFNNFTPLQMAYATSILANNGRAIKPHLLDQVLNKSGKVIKQVALNSQQIKISQSNLQLIKKAMQSVITSGTGRAIGQGLKYTMAGKTGTAQVVGIKQDSRKSKYLGEQYKDHSWFIAFAPVDKPKIALAIIIENGGWGTKSAPIARQLFDSYLVSESSAYPINKPKYKKFKPQQEDLASDNLPDDLNPKENIANDN